MKRKKMGICLAALLVCTASTTVFGAEVSNKDENQTVTTSLSYKVASDYVVVIPQAVTLDNTIQIKATTINTETDCSVEVRVNGLDEDGNVVLARTTEQSYTIKAPLKMNESSLKNNDVVAEFKDKNTVPVNGTGTLKFGDAAAADNDPQIKAGTYEGTLTFRVAYVESIFKPENQGG